MSKKLQLTLAMGDYEIVRALKEGIVQPDGIELNVLTNMDSTTRHWRFLRKQPTLAFAEVMRRTASSSENRPMSRA